MPGLSARRHARRYTLCLLLDQAITAHFGAALRSRRHGALSGDRAEFIVNDVHDNSTVAIYDTHTTAETAVHELRSAGIDLNGLSIVGKDYRTEDHVVGYYSTGGRLKYWGKLGTFWGEVWGLVNGEAFF